MPIVKTKKTPDYTYSLWRIDEDFKELMSKLNAEEKEISEIQNIHNVHRKNQNIAARLILNHLANKKVTLAYLENGSPYCKEFRHISISHSNKYSALVVSKNPIGIDIQYKKANIDQLKNKFIHPIEENYLQNKKETIPLHFIWCAKEAIYKTLNSFCSFKDNIIINKIEEKPSIGYGYYKNDGIKKKYTLYYKRFNNYFLVLAKS